MSASWMRCAAVATAVALAATGCGAEDKPSADPHPSASSSRVTPTESASPTARPQPRSTTGATYDILNWDEYADDPALLAWKKALESAAGSMGRGRLQPGLRENTTPTMFRVYNDNVTTGLHEGWQVKPLTQVRVESSKTRGTRTTLRLCLWSPTSSVYQKDGTPVGDDSVIQQWDRQVVQVTQAGGRFRVAALKIAGVCKGVPRP